MSKKEPKTYHVFQCQNCEDKPEFEAFDALKEHLQTVHGIDTKTTPAERVSTLHLDGRETYENHWRITVGGVEIAEVWGGEREDDDMMRFA